MSPGGVGSESHNNNSSLLLSKKFHTGLWRTLLDETERAWSGTFPASPKSDGGLRYSPANSRIHQPVYPQ